VNLLSRSRVRAIKIIDATAGFALCWILGYLRHLTGRPRVPAIIGPGKIRHILVIRPGGMGDMIMLLPAIRRIREEFPAAAVDFICERRNLEILRLAGLAENAIPYDAAPVRLMRRLRATAYDVAIDTEQFHHFSAVLALMSGAPVRIGFKINPHRNLLYTHLINYALDGYEGRQFMRLLAPLGIPDSGYRLDGILADAVPVAPPAVQTELAKLRAAGPFVVVAPGSSTIYKQWETDKFVRLVQALTRGRAVGVALVGGADAVKPASMVLKHTGDQQAVVMSLAGRLNLADTTAFLRQAQLFIGTDSGLAHLAVALGIPTVVIFGPSDHVKWGVDDERHAVVRKDMACSPCFIFGYHRLCRTFACMSAVEVEDVLAACDRLRRSGKAEAAN
jgi:ADP-heptose:LPS heptosyltransferase